MVPHRKVLGRRTDFFVKKKVLPWMLFDSSTYLVNFDNVLFYAYMSFCHVGVYLFAVESVR